MICMTVLSNLRAAIYVNWLIDWFTHIVIHQKIGSSETWEIEEKTA